MWDPDALNRWQLAAAGDRRLAGADFASVNRSAIGPRTLATAAKALGCFGAVWVGLWLLSPADTQHRPATSWAAGPAAPQSLAGPGAGDPPAASGPLASNQPVGASAGPKATRAPRSAVGHPPPQAAPKSAVGSAAQPRYINRAPAAPAPWACCQARSASTSSQPTTVTTRPQQPSDPHQGQQTTAPSAWHAPPSHVRTTTGGTENGRATTQRPGPGANPSTQAMR